MATLQKLFHDWLEWRLATARLRAVSMNAMGSAAQNEVEGRETVAPDSLRPAGLANGNLCPGSAV